MSALYPSVFAVLTFIVTAGLLACGEPERAVDDAAPEAEPIVDPIEGCEETDFASLPWQGPGVVDGQLVADADSVVGATALLLWPGADAQADFDAYMGPAVAELFAVEGMLGTTMGQSATCRTARTLTVWRDYESMMQYVVSPGHVAAVGAVEALGEAYKTTVFSVGQMDASGLDWPRQRAELARVPARVFER